jgi:phage shock protein A
MGLFARLGSLIKSNLNDLISKSEDPEKMLNQVLIDMQNQLVEAKKQVAVAIADEKRLRKQLDDERAKAAEWERKAMLAIKAGDDNLARQALGRKAEHDTIATQFDGQWKSQHEAVEKLKDALRQLSEKIEEAKRKKNILIARQKRAEAQKAIQATMQGLSDSSALDTFGRMAEKVDQIEAEAEASTELGAALTGDSLDQQFKQLEAGGGTSDDALAQLKQKMGLLPPPAAAGQLGPAPKKDEDVSDAEVVSGTSKSGDR